MSKDHLLDFLGIDIHSGEVDFVVLSATETESYTRQLIRYAGSEGDEITAFLFLPRQAQPIGSVLVHHQHHGERHLGKSEVAGLAGDPHQFFCPALAKAGLVVLAPDSICFEDRRRNKRGIAPDDDPDQDWLQHYNEMSYRMLQGKSLMKKVIDDSSIAISLLAQLPDAQHDRIGLLGHSYGGNTVIFHSPFDTRITHSCSSGAVCSYRNKFASETGIELAEVIPGFAIDYDIEDLLRRIAPRKLLILSATEDIYSQDARAVYQATRPAYAAAGASDAIELQEYPGPHALDSERFHYIIDWFTQQFST